MPEQAISVSSIVNPAEWLRSARKLSDTERRLAESWLAEMNWTHDGAWWARADVSGGEPMPFVSALLLQSEFAVAPALRGLGYYAPHKPGLTCVGPVCYVPGAYTFEPGDARPKRVKDQPAGISLLAAAKRAGFLGLAVE